MSFTNSQYGEIHFLCYKAFWHPVFSLSYSHSETNVELFSELLIVLQNLEEKSPPLEQIN